MKEIIIGDKGLYTRIQSYFRAELPDKLSLLKLYDDPSFPLDKLYSTQTILEKALRERAWLKTGGYLIIQPTEALTVIDVNTGKFDRKGQMEATFLKTNLEAAKEAARQMRLRNLSGIILIDFIDMALEESRQKLIRTLKDALREDPVKADFVGITKLGLAEITRKKVRRPLAETVRARQPGFSCTD